MVLPMRISEAIAAEWVMPEQPIVSTRASSMMPFLIFRLSLHAPCCGAHQPTPWVKPEKSFFPFPPPPSSPWRGGGNPALATTPPATFTF